MDMFTAEQTLILQNGGTWSEMFDRASLVNSNGLITIFIWLGAFFLLGISFFPLTSLVFGKMKDSGWAVARLFGLVILGYSVWLGAFLGWEYTRPNILILWGFWLFINVLVLLRKRELFLRWRSSLPLILKTEAVFLGCFVFFLLIRLGNPDLWHPYKGGERPMDFSYFNAILKSTVFPPYDPWFAGGYLNYYYYGMFLSGIMVKVLGIIPSVGFNLILALWFAFLGSAAYGMGHILYAWTRGGSEKNAERAGLISLFFMQFIGNLGTPVQIKNELVELGAGMGPDQVHGFFRQFSAFFAGLGKLLSGMPLAMYKGDWYWIPSRAIPDSSITEFPFFTFLYGDPHAHLFALPVTVLALLWLVCLILRLETLERRGVRTAAELLGCFLAGGLIIGTLIPTNTWDMPTYLCISGAVLIFTLIRTGAFSETERPDRRRVFEAVLCVGFFCAAAFLLFVPYFRTNYREDTLELWNESFTPIRSFLMHWGLFLFMIVSWYAVETRNWMARTPLRSWFEFRRKNSSLLTVGCILAIAILIALVAYGVRIVWIVLPIMVWSLVLLFRPGEKSLTRLVIFLIGVACFAAVLVEMIHLVGDNGRMNTVFKFYNQIWVMLSLCAAYAFASLLDLLRAAFSEGRFQLWKSAAVLLIAGCFMYPIFAGTDKVTDRMADAAPHTLDGMTYMKYANYWQDGFDMDLSQDHDAIVWMQENVKGSPVIVEANATEYKFGTRYTMYTGLPGVVGWNYHQRQQRGPISQQVWDRVNQIAAFYNTTDTAAAEDFLKTYGVRFIVVGQMERGLYEADGIRKFEENDGTLWNKVYSAFDTTIYEVN